MSALFRPAREDGRSIGQVVADYIAERIVAGTVSAGDVVPHSELMAVLGMDDRGSAYYQAVSHGTRLLQRQCSRSLRAVRGAGYQLIEGRQMLDQGRVYQGRSRRALGRGLETVQTIDGSALVAGDRQMVREVAKGMANIVQILSLQAERLAGHDEEINMLKAGRMEDRARVRATEHEVADIRERLRRLEEGE